MQDWVGQRETLVGSQLWWNWEVDTKRYWGWQQLVQDLGAQHIKVMTYCNPCVAPVLTPSLMLLYNQYSVIVLIDQLFPIKVHCLIVQ